MDIFCPPVSGCPLRLLARLPADSALSDFRSWAALIYGLGFYVGALLIFLGVRSRDTA